MIIYTYDPTTKEYIGTDKADADPLNKGDWLVPACATTCIPPVSKPGFVRVFNRTSWQYKPDQRGLKYWLRDGTMHHIETIGEIPPSGSLTIPPHSPFHSTHDGCRWIIDTPLLASSRRQERDAKISDAYSPAIQQLTRWIDSNREVPEPLAYYTRQRDAWHAWADALCALPDQPGFPWPEGEVPWPEQPPRPTPYDATNNS